MKNSPDEIKNILSSHDLKTTPFRMLLIEILMTSKGPRSAAQLMAEMTHKRSKIKFDRVTLFRNLKNLEEKGLINAADFGQGASYYSLRLESRHQHHILCVKCERTEPLDACVISPMVEKATRRGFKVLSHHLELTGLCPKCA